MMRYDECSECICTLDSRQILVKVDGEEFRGEVPEEVRGVWSLGASLLLVWQASRIEIRPVTAFLFAGEDQREEKEAAGGVLIDDEDVKEVLYEEDRKWLWFLKRNKTILAHCEWNLSTFSLHHAGRFIIDEQSEIGSQPLSSLINQAIKLRQNSPSSTSHFASNQIHGDNGTLRDEYFTEHRENIPTWSLSLGSDQKKTVSEIGEQLEVPKGLVLGQKVPENISSLLKVSRIQVAPQYV